MEVGEWRELIGEVGWRVEKRDGRVREATLQAMCACGRRENRRWTVVESRQLLDVTVGDGRWIGVVL